MTRSQGALLLAIASGTVVGIVLAALVLRRRHPSRALRGTEGMAVDVLIVGGGVSGLFCAARLRRFRPDLSVLLIERASEIGGRIKSVSVPASPWPADCRPAECGAMRFFPGEDAYTSALIDALRLPSEVVPYDAPGNPVYVRGLRTTFAALPREAPEAFALRPDERGRAPLDLVAEAMEKVLGPYPADSAYDVPRLNAVSFRNAIQPLVSNEAVHYIATASGYDFLLGDVSASTGITENRTLLSRQGSPQRFVVGGFSRVTDGLAASLRRSAHDGGGFLVELGTALARLRVRSTGDARAVARVTCREGSRDAGATVLAGTVILTMQKEDLSRVARFPPATEAVMDAVEPWRAAKVFVMFDRPWWVPRYGPLAGRSVTDLPMRQVWYWCERPPVLLIYADDVDSAYWAPLLTPPLPTRWRAPEEAPALISTLVAQLSEMYAVPESEIRPVSLLWRYWPCGTHLWRPASDLPEAMRRIAAPFGEDAPVRVVGDSWSGNQGWVNGALWSCDEALRRRWGIPSLLAELNARQPRNDDVPDATTQRRNDGRPKKP